MVVGTTEIEDKLVVGTTQIEDQFSFEKVENTFTDFFFIIISISNIHILAIYTSMSMVKISKFMTPPPSKINLASLGELAREGEGLFEAGYLV